MQGRNPVSAQGQPLVEGLGAGIGPAGAHRGPEAEIVVLPERDLRALAVDLRRRDHDHGLPLPRCGLEHCLGGSDVGVDDVGGLFDDQPDPDRRRQVKRDVGSVHELHHQRRIEGASNAVLESRPADEVLDVDHRSGREVVEHDHCVAPFEQLGQMGADDPSAAGDQCFHRPRPCHVSRTCASRRSMASPAISR